MKEIAIHTRVMIRWMLRTRVLNAKYAMLRFIYRIYHTNEWFSVQFNIHYCALLVLQVLRLFHFLVKFGYYGSEDIKSLLKPLLNLLNGKLDKPFPPDNEKGGRTWWRHEIESFSALLALCAGNSPVTGESPSQRPVTRSFDVFFDLRLNKRLSKQSWDWWFETPSCSLWRRCNERLVLLLRRRIS